MPKNVFLGFFISRVQGEVPGLGEKPGRPRKLPGVPALTPHFELAKDFHHLGLNEAEPPEKVDRRVVVQTYPCQECGRWNTKSDGRVGGGVQ